MAIKKPGKGSRPTSVSRARSSGRGMAIDKAHTPAWMKATLILLAIVFASSFVSIGATSCSQTFDTTQQTTDPVAAAQAKYQGSVDALNSAIASEPANYDLLTGLANTYFDWALELTSLSQTSTAAGQAAPAKWTSAIGAYQRALEASAGTSEVKTDYATALLYSGDTTGAAKAAAGVIKDDPSFAMAHVVLGQASETLGDNKTAVANYQKYLDLDKANKWGNADYVKGRISALSGAVSK